MTSFVGRRREVTLARRMLAESRVVTLTGPGGIGKSRLALRVATGMHRAFKDKVWQVELGELDDSTLLAATVIEQLGLGDTSAGDDVADLVEHLREREMLLVLDNCEHLVRACALLVDTLVRSCPGLRVLATSRQSLGVTGESTLVVPPLQAPAPEESPGAEAYEQYAAVRLFVDRARAVIPEFEVTDDNVHVLMRLCHRLDGNPLAIELAVVRLRSLSPKQLDERLSSRQELLTEGRRGAPARQQTLRALVDWSYELCTEQDRRAWARMSVFSGSFELAAVEHVVGPGTEPAGVAGVVHSLVDKSILEREQHGEHSRYRLPHALRDYGLERLEEAGEREATERRHRSWYASLVDRFAAEWIGPDQASWVEHLHAEQANLRAALHTATASAQPPSRPRSALRMAAGLGRYWATRGQHSEARHWLERAVTADTGSGRERAAALRAGAWFALLQGDVTTAEPLLSEAETVAEQHDSRVEQAYLTHTHGMAALLRGEPAPAAEMIGTALAVFRSHHVADGELFALFGLGLARGLGDEREQGLTWLRECIQITTALGEVFWRSYALWAVACVEIERDAAERADQAAKEALRLQSRMGNHLAIAFGIDTLAWIACRKGNERRAAQLFGAAAAAWEAVRSAPSFYATFAEAHSRYYRHTRESVGEQAFVEEYERGNRWPPGTAIEQALEGRKRRESPRDNVHPMPLTRREREIAELVAKGRTNKEIAERLVIAQRTVEGHVQHVLTKLDFNSRAQIAGWVAGQERSG